MRSRSMLCVFSASASLGVAQAQTAILDEARRLPATRRVARCPATRPPWLRRLSAPEPRRSAPRIQFRRTPRPVAKQPVTQRFPREATSTLRSPRNTAFGGCLHSRPFDWDIAASGQRQHLALPAVDERPVFTSASSSKGSIARVQHAHSNDRDASATILREPPLVASSVAVANTHGLRRDGRLGVSCAPCRPCVLPLRARPSSSIAVR
jgi:hypothetical protein